MPKLKTLKFETFDEMMEYYDINERDIILHTLDMLKQAWKIHKKPTTVDVYKVELKHAPELKFMSILGTEWQSSFDEGKTFFVKNSLFEEAALIRNFEKEVFNIKE